MPWCQAEVSRSWPECNHATAPPQLEPDPAVQESGGTYRTPEGRYLVELLEGTDYAMAKGLLDDLYGEDVLGTTRLLESLRWEVPTELEEAARRWRDGRLRDAGFPDLDEAAAFYARPPAAKSAPASAATPALLAPVSNLLERALEELSGKERERAEEGILYASNAALVANAVSGDDFEELRDTLADARATLALGLEILSGGDLQVAARVLAERPVRQIFQTAMAEAYRLQARARRAAAAAFIAHRYWEHGDFGMRAGQEAQFMKNIAMRNFRPAR